MIWAWFWLKCLHSRLQLWSFIKNVLHLSPAADSLLTWGAEEAEWNLAQMFGENVQNTWPRIAFKVLPRSTLQLLNSMIGFRNLNKVTKNYITVLRDICSFRDVSPQGSRTLLIISEHLSNIWSACPVVGLWWQWARDDWWDLLSTFQVADTTHGSKHCRLHLDVPDSSLMSFPQILQLFLSGERAKCPIQSTLP